MKKIKITVTIILSAAAFSGCALVQPWEREHLADPIMQLDYMQEEKGVLEHMFGTREGSTGGYGAGGGGCGCN